MSDKEYWKQWDIDYKAWDDISYKGKKIDIYEPHGASFVPGINILIVYGHENIFVLDLDTGDLIKNIHTR